jgi:signal transduction histidine kinase
MERPTEADSRPTESIGGAVLVDQDEARRLIHDLRNSLNTLLINASLFTRHARDDPRLEKAAGFLESAGTRCAEDLNRLGELFRGPSVPPSSAR